MGVDRCLICERGCAEETGDFIKDGSTRPITWRKLCSVLSIKNEDKRPDKFGSKRCPLCTQCFKIVDYMDQLTSRLRDIQNDIRFKRTSLRERMKITEYDMASMAGLYTPDDSTLHYFRQTLVHLLDNQDSRPELDVKPEIFETQRTSATSYQAVTILPDEDEHERASTEEEDSYLLDEPLSLNENSKISNSTATRKTTSQTRKKRPHTESKESLRSTKRKLTAPAEASCLTKKGGEKAMPYNCSDCAMGYMSLGGYIKHRKVVHLEEGPKFDCSICDKVFDRKRDKNEHEKVEHEGIYPCPVCGRKFKILCRLELHVVLSHETPEKSHSCDLCGKMFTQEISLKRHVRLHKYEKYKPFICELCDCRWTTEEELKFHQHSRHNKSPEQLYAKRQLLSQLKPNQGEDTLGTNYDDDEVTSKASRYVSRFPCHLCTRSFTKFQYLQSHLKSHDVFIQKPAEEFESDSSMGALSSKTSISSTIISSSSDCSNPKPTSSSSSSASSPVPSNAAIAMKKAGNLNKLTKSRIVKSRTSPSVSPVGVIVLNPPISLGPYRFVLPKRVSEPSEEAVENSDYNYNIFL